MADKKIIAVVGATGAQGSGLVRAIMSDVNSDFTARALTRNVNSDKAKELAELGAEVVTADVDNLESLKKAFQGAYGAFCVTFFWEHFSPEKEFAQAKAMATAAKDDGLGEYVILGNAVTAIVHRGKIVLGRRISLLFPPPVDTNSRPPDNPAARRGRFRT